MRALTNLLAQFGPLRRFRMIKQRTRGYLSPEVYKAIYDCAYSASEGYLVDIGPAQGGSSISMGLALKDSRKTRSKVFSIEKGQGSDALVSREAPEMNARVWRRNIETFGVDEFCQLLLGDVALMHSEIDQNQPLAMLFIDADGALDRDFHLFFNRLVDGAPIVIDDYFDVINRFAREKYLKWSSVDELESYVRSKNAVAFRDLCPLGKEQTTWRFLNYLTDANLVEHEQTLGRTFFGRKVKGAIFDQTTHGEAMNQIRTENEREYYALIPSLQPPM